MKIEGSVALVTGSAKRVGRVLAGELARRGARLAIHYNTSRSEALELGAELKARHGTESAVFKADLGRAKDAAGLARLIRRRFGRLDILVNSASVYKRTPFGEVSEADWDEHLDVNLKGPFFLSQAAGLMMREAGRGKIVNIADWAGLRPYPGYAPYCASKAGLICLTQSLAKALAPEVQVNAVLPGPVLLPEDVGAKEREAIRNATLVKRIGSPADVAAAVIYFVEQDFVTGASLPVDGGRLIQ